MKLGLDNVRVLCGDSIAVKAVETKNKKGLFVPSGGKVRGKCWRAEILKFGEGVDFEAWKPYTCRVGDIVFVRPIAMDCEMFEDPIHGEYSLIRDEDIFAKEELNG